MHMHDSWRCVTFILGLIKGDQRWSMLTSCYNLSYRTLPSSSMVYWTLPVQNIYWKEAAIYPPTIPSLLFVVSFFFAFFIPFSSTSAFFSKYLLSPYFFPSSPGSSYPRIYITSLLIFFKQRNRSIIVDNLLCIRRYHLVLMLYWHHCFTEFIASCFFVNNAIKGVQ